MGVWQYPILLPLLSILQPPRDHVSIDSPDARPFTYSYYNFDVIRGGIHNDTRAYVAWLVSVEFVDVANA